MFCSMLVSCRIYVKRLFRDCKSSCARLGAMSRRSFFESVRENGGDISRAPKHQVVSHLTSCGVDEAILADRDAGKHVFAFIARLRAKWQKAGRHTARFLSENRDWLEKNIIHDSMASLTLERPRGPQNSRLRRRAKGRKGW